MAKSSHAQHVGRINTAFQLLRRPKSLSEASTILSDRFGVSERQARRYIKEALNLKAPLPEPEPKEVSTVKLPVSLIDQLRHHPRAPGQSLSDFVAEALQQALTQRKARGR